MNAAPIDPEDELQAKVEQLLASRAGPMPIDRRQALARRLIALIRQHDSIPVYATIEER